MNISKVTPSQSKDVSSEEAHIRRCAEEIAQRGPYSLVFTSPIEQIKFVCSDDGISEKAFDAQKVQDAFEDALKIIRDSYPDLKNRRANPEGFKMRVEAYDAQGECSVYRSSVLYIPLGSPWTGKAP